MEDLIDSDGPKIEDSFRNALKWWEPKRGWYNAVFILAFVLGHALSHYNDYYFFRLHEVVLWVVVCNLGYSLGWGGELFLRFWLKTPAFNTPLRWFLFIGGSLFAGFVTFALAYDNLL